MPTAIIPDLPIRWIWRTITSYPPFESYAPLGLIRSYGVREVGSPAMLDPGGDEVNELDIARVTSSSLLFGGL